MTRPVLICRPQTHIDRILGNAAKAKIPHSFTSEQLVDIICQTVRASGLRTGSVRYYLTAGHGGFGWLPDECEEPGFYVMVVKGGAAGPDHGGLDPIREATVDPRFLRPKFLAQTKSNNCENPHDSL